MAKIAVPAKQRKIATDPAAPPAEADRPLLDSHPRGLVMSHSHPRVTRGGAEISAYALYQALKDRGGSAWFLSCAVPGAGSGRPGARFTQPYGPDEYIYYSE